MKISVIIPTYKPQEYLWKCLASLKSQTLPSDRFEILIILNGDKEPYCSMINEYLKNEFSNSVHVKFFYAESAGVSNARNMGLDNAAGEYITFLDDDDYVSESYLEGLLNSSSHSVIGCAHPVAFDSNGIREYTLENVWQSIEGRQPIPYLKARRLFQGPCMKLIHRNIIGERRFSPRFRNGEDALFMFAVSDKFQYVSASSEKEVYFRRIRIDGAAYGKKTLFYKITNSIKLISAYTSIYFSHPFQYSFLFYITRVMGAIKMSFN